MCHLPRLSCWFRFYAFVILDCFCSPGAKEGGGGEGLLMVPVGAMGLCWSGDSFFQAVGDGRFMACVQS